MPVPTVFVVFFVLFFSQVTVFILWIRFDLRLFFYYKVLFCLLEVFPLRFVLFHRKFHLLFMGRWKISSNFVFHFWKKHHMKCVEIFCFICTWKIQNTLILPQTSHPRALNSKTSNVSNTYFPVNTNMVTVDAQRFPTGFCSYCVRF